MQANDKRTKVYKTHEGIFPMLADSSKWLQPHGDLDPSTEPAAIIAAQHEEVSAAVHSLRALNQPILLATLSAITCLPVWSVKRHLEALGVISDEPVEIDDSISQAEMMRSHPEAFRATSPQGSLGRRTLAKWSLVESYGSAKSKSGGKPRARARKAVAA